MNRYRFDAATQKALEKLRMPLAVYQFVDKRVVTIMLSDGFCELFEFDNKADAYYMMDHDMYEATHPDDAARVANAAFRFATEGGRYEVIYRTYTNKTNTYKIVHSIGEHVYTDDGVRLAYVWYTDEGSYTAEGDGSGQTLNHALSSALHNESLLNAGYYDYLTGLPSMSYFFELADTYRRLLIVSGGTMAMLYMDLCGMKYYNRKYGFAEGDKMLQAFANLLKKHFSNENCSRFGSDHFCVYTVSDGLEEKLGQIFSEIREATNHKMLSVRVGICLDSDGTHDISAECDRAKYACDTMRNSYVSRFCYFDNSMLEKAENTRYIIAHLDEAIREQRIRVFFQPIVRAANGKVCDEEALARWLDPARGMLSPGEFIPILEEAKLIYKLDLYVVEQILKKMKKQREAGLFLVPQSVNLSRVDFDTCDIVEEIRRRVDAAGIPRDRISIEVTESSVGTDFDFMKLQIERFRDLGFRVWMDDFGSGYSALDMLQSIRFDLIKFDMRFMKEFDKGDKSRIILTELIRMAIALGIDTVCEGVETKEQAEFLREVGCTKLQGFYFCRAIPFDGIVERYRTGTQIGLENPEETDYYAAIGKINLYDLAVVGNEDEEAFERYFNTLPMAVIESAADGFRLLRCNKSYRDFLKKRFGYFVLGKRIPYDAKDGSFGGVFAKGMLECGESGPKMLLDEELPDGTVIHLFMRMIARNPVKGTKAIAVVILAVTDAKDAPVTFTQVARALSSDYINVYYVNLKTDQFLEYSSDSTEAALDVERHGTGFFESCLKDALRPIYPEDQSAFEASFTKENVVDSIRRHGAFMINYRLILDGVPTYVILKAVQPKNDGNHLIVGVYNIDAQMRQQEVFERLQQERITYSRISALSGDILCIYTVDPETDYYTEYIAADLYKAIGIPKSGEDFFEDSLRFGLDVICPEDWDYFRSVWFKENIMREIERNGMFELKYCVKIESVPHRVCLRGALVEEKDGSQLIVGLFRLESGSDNGGDTCITR